jgi:hypothetical protein
VAGIAAFALLGIFTPVEMRSLLAGQPVVALLAAFAMTAAWARPILRALVVLAGAAAVATFLRLAASIPG